MALLVSDVARQVRKRFGDPGGVVIKDQDIFDFVNDAQKQIVRITETNITASVGVVASALPYIGASDIIAYTKVLYKPVSNLGGRPLVFTTQDDLLAKGLDLSYTGTPEYWYVPDNAKTLYTYPAPLSTDSTSVLIYFTKLPTAVTAVGNALSVQDQFQQDVVTFCVARCHEVNENWIAANAAMQEFLNGIGQNRYEAMSAEDGYTVVRDDPYEYEYGNFYY